MTLHDMCADIAALLNPMPAPVESGDESDEEAYGHAADEAMREREDMAEGLRMSWAEEDTDPLLSTLADLRNRRLQRRCVEHLPLAAAVIVHRHVERRCHVLRSTFDDGPGVTLPPPHRHAVCACPFDQRLRARRVGQRDRELHATIAGWTEIR